MLNEKKYGCVFCDLYEHCERKIHSTQLESQQMCVCVCVWFGGMTHFSVIIYYVLTAICSSFCKLAPYWVWLQLPLRPQKVVTQPMFVMYAFRICKISATNVLKWNEQQHKYTAALLPSIHDLTSAFKCCSILVHGFECCWFGFILPIQPSNSSSSIRHAMMHSNIITHTYK